MLREQADAEESGVDLERNKNWEWSIEDNEKWEAKLAEKEAGKNIGFVGQSLCRLGWDGRVGPHLLMLSVSLLTASVPPFSHLTRRCGLGQQVLYSADQVD